MEGVLHLDERDSAVCRRAYLRGKDGIKGISPEIIFFSIPAGNRLVFEPLLGINLILEPLLGINLILEPQALTGRAATTGFSQN